MVLKKEEWTKITTYIKDQLCNQLGLEGTINRAIIVGTLQELSLDEFLKSVGEKKKRKKSVDIVYSPEFEEWWSLFPTGKGFTYNNVKVLASERSLRDDKEKTFKKYQEVKDATPVQLLHALKVEVEKRKIESAKTGENKFQYMKASIAYLNIKRYNFYVNEPIPDAQKSGIFTDYSINI
jgi:hypothetical protein